ncbi:MAG: aminotransferase class V-fold PLP-dependent enzyme [Gemmatimonadota bacterium]|nr:aminotransferase class V-fold PLP-dependent enzyme [Gemmatimonadota bacterium]
MNQLTISPNDFPAVEKCTYINAANVALMYRGASEGIVAWQEDVAENGSNNFDEAAEEAVFFGLHEAGARLFNASPADIAGGSSATDLLSSLAWAVIPGAGTNVVSSEIAFPTAVYPWARIANHTGCEIRLAPAVNGYVDPDALRSLIDDNTAVVSLSHVEFRSGQLYDLTAFADIAHAHGALLVVDATQSAGAVPIDATGDGVDAVIAGGYKWLCGPFGAALMYLAPHLHTVLEPGLVGYRSNAEIWNFDAKRIDYAEDASRFEFSTMAYGCAVGLTVAIEYLNDAGIDNIFAHNQVLADKLIEGLESLGVTVTSPQNAEERCAIVTAQFPGRDPAVVTQRFKEAGVMVACRQDVVRFSPHLYNKIDDIGVALACVDEIISSVV